MIKDECTPYPSAIIPWKTGNIAPPSIIITSNDEPWLVNFPSPAIDRAKILDHMIELNKPMAMIDHKAT